jgi:MFS family permease
MAIAASLLGRDLARRFSEKHVYLAGLGANLAAMGAPSRDALRDARSRNRARRVLAAPGFLGIGFGLTVPALNNSAAAFFPDKVDGANLALNALLGVGTALAPVFVALFVGLGIWWGMPLMVSVTGLRPVFAGGSVVSLALAALAIAIVRGPKRARVPSSRPVQPTVRA